MNEQFLQQVGTLNPPYTMINGDVMRMTQNGVLLPYIKDHVFCNYGKNFFTTFAENWMDKQYDSSTEIYHTEESPQVYTVKIAAVTNAAAAGGRATITYSNANVGGFAPVQVGYFVSLPPLAKSARVISVDPTTKTFVISPADITYKITQSVGQEIIIVPAALAAACACTTFLSSVKGPGLMFKSQMAIIKKFMKVCGEDLASWLSDRWLFPLMSVTDPCEEVNVWWHSQLDTFWAEFLLAKQLIAMTGEDITNTNTASANDFKDDGNYIKGTIGIMHLLRSRAQQEPVPSSVGITIDYFRRITARLKTMRNYCNQYGVWSGYEHRSQIDATFENMGSIQRTEEMSCAFMGGSKQRCLQFGFDGIKLDGIEFYFHDEDSLNDPGFLGASGFTGPWTTFMVPLCKLPCGNKMSTAFIMRYLSGNGVNRELIENDYGILRPGSQNSNCDWHEWMLMSQFGIDAYCMNNFIFTESI